MTHDLGRRLAEQLDDAAPPLGIDAEILAAVGRKRMRAKRFTVGGLTAGVAALAAAAVVLPAAFGSGGGPGPAADPSDAASAFDEQPSFPLPETDPDTLYYWTAAGPVTATAETERLEEALWEFLQGEGLELKTDGEDGDRFVPVTRENFPGFGRVEQRLAMRGDHWEPIDYVQPVYVLGTDLFLQYDPDGRYSDQLGVTFTPKGGYLPGPGGGEAFEGYPAEGFAPHLYAGCEDFRFDAQTSTGNAWKADFTCTQTTTGGGEAVDVAELVMNNPTGVSYRVLTVTVYRADGNAVTLTDRMMHHLVDDAPNLADLATTGYALDADALIALAEALPDVIVK